VLIRAVEWIRRHRAPGESRRGFRESRILRAKCSRVLDVTRIIRGEVTQWKPCSTFASAPSSPKAAAGRRGRDKRKKEAKPHGEKIKLDRMQLFSCCLQAVSLSYSSIQVEKIYTPAKLHLHTQAENPSILLSAPTQEWMRGTRLLFSTALRGNGRKGSRLLKIENCWGFIIIYKSFLLSTKDRELNKTPC
jgi:hypothetical protein